MFSTLSQGASTSQPIPAFFTPAFVGTLLVGIIVTAVFELFVYNATAVGVAHLYAGKPVAFRSCYRIVLSRWARLVGMMLMCIPIYIGFTTVAVVLAMLFFVPAAMMATSGRGPSIVLDVLGGLVVLGIACAGAVTLAAVIFSFYGISIEGLRTMAAIGAGFARVFTRREFWRALGLIVCMLIVSVVVGGIASGLGSVALLLLHLPWLSALLVTVVSLAVTPFSIILMAVYYYDVRIRHEGIDLEAKVERLVAGDIAPA